MAGWVLGLGPCFEWVGDGKKSMACEVKQDYHEAREALKAALLFLSWGDLHFKEAHF